MIGAKANLRTRGLRAVSPSGDGTGASPNALAAASTCRQLEPAPTRAVRASGSIDTRASSRVTTKIVPTPPAGAVCPVACTATRRPLRAASRTAAATSQASAAMTTISGASSPAEA